MPEAGPEALRWLGWPPSMGDRYFSVVAMLIDEETPEPRTRFPELVDRLLIPYKVFTDETDALDFLSESIPR
jgi:hypothetical protein